jgi:DNA polymerase-2
MDEIDRMFAEDKPALALQPPRLRTGHAHFREDRAAPFLLERASVTGLPADRMARSRLSRISTCR